MSKKNNKTSVSDAEREIPTLESTENAGNSVNLVPALSFYPRVVGISLFASETNDRFCLLPRNHKKGPDIEDCVGRSVIN